MTIDAVRNALVDLRAIARGNGSEVRMGVERPERHAPVEVRVRVCGTVASLRRGEDAVELIHALIRGLERCNVTSRLYES